MSVPLEDLSVAALKDLGRVRRVEGSNGMRREELLAALGGPVDDALAPLLGRRRQDLYALAGERGIEGRMEMDKRALLEALAAQG